MGQVSDKKIEEAPSSGIQEHLMSLQEKTETTGQKVDYIKERLQQLKPQKKNIDQLRDPDNKGSRETELVQWDKNKNVFLIDFTDLPAQGKMMNRLAAFIEKKDAPHDRVLNDRELSDFIEKTHETKNPATFYYGHDYKADDLVRFFNQAHEQNIGLNLDEEILEQTLVKNNFMKPYGVVKTSEGRQYTAYKTQEPLKALVTFTEETPNAEKEDEQIAQASRERTLNHEITHGVFFTEKEYRDYCTYFWKNNVDQPLKEYFKTFLKGADYDVDTSEYLLINEMQAFLLTRDWQGRLTKLKQEQWIKPVLAIREEFIKRLPPKVRGQIQEILASK